VDVAHLGNGLAPRIQDVIGHDNVGWPSAFAVSTDVMSALNPPGGRPGSAASDRHPGPETGPATPMACRPRDLQAAITELAVAVTH
jgi:hypothetical protein